MPMAEFLPTCAGRAGHISHVLEHKNTNNINACCKALIELIIVLIHNMIFPNSL